MQQREKPVEPGLVAGVSHTGKGRGCVFFDYDNDGWQDLYVTCAGPNVLYHNNGDGTFTDVTAHAGVGDEKHGTSIAVADYDHDGWLDLYVINWGKNPSLLIFNPPRKDNVLYRNRGNGTFEDVSQTAGVADDGIGWGGIFFDYDGDTWADLLVANDHGGDKLYRNRGDGTFEDVTASANIEITVNGNIDNSQKTNVNFVEGGNPIVAVKPKGKIPTTLGGMKNTELLQNYPNPFNPETWIPYQLSCTR